MKEPLNSGSLLVSGACLISTTVHCLPWLLGGSLLREFSTLLKSLTVSGGDCAT